MTKREYVKGCLVYIFGVGIPGIIVGTMVVPVAFGILSDLPKYGAALLLPNQPQENVDAAISDVLSPQSTYEPPAYVEGTCEELKKQGLRNFFRGEPNYTPERDPNNDGLACEDI